MKVPSTTILLLTLLEDLYPDTMELDPTCVGTPDYWKKAGVIELIQKLKHIAGRDTLLQKE